MTARLRVLTWPIHGSYMTYLAHVPVDWYIPYAPDRDGPYGGRWAEWPDNVHQLPERGVRQQQFDVVLYQHRDQWFDDQQWLLSAEQRELPRVFLEHDPPREHPTDTRHFVADADVLLVHVTHFNALMWDSGRTPTRVIRHGVTVPPDVEFSGEIARGITVINNLPTRGRRLGADVFLDVRDRQHVPLDLLGMGSLPMGGLGDVKLPDLPAFIARYRFFFNPIRYTSLGLAVCEAMLCGLPIVGLATTEMVNVIQNGVSGYLDTDIDALVDAMRELIADRGLALRLAKGAREAARELFSIERFAGDWLATLEQVVAARGSLATTTAGTQLLERVA